MTKFSVGQVFSLGFGIWFKNLTAFLLITAFVYTPVIIWGLTTVYSGNELEQVAVSFVEYTQYSALLSVLLNIAASAALTYGVVMELQGQHAGAGASIATGIARFFPALGVAILTMLCVAVGMVALIVPGIIVACMLYVSTQVAVLERPGLVASLNRSAELTKGHRTEIFVITFILGLISYGVTQLIDSTMIDAQTLNRDNLLDRMQSATYVMLVRDIVLGSLGSVFGAVAYYLLRAEKEGTSAHELGRIFE